MMSQINQQEIEKIARNYFSDQHDQQKVMDAISDAFNKAADAVGAAVAESQPAAPSLADQAASYIRTGINYAASHIEKQAKGYMLEHSSMEPDTGAVSWHYGDAGRDHHSTLVELAEEIRALSAPVAPVPAASEGWTENDGFQPVSDDVRVDVELGNGNIHRGDHACEWCWDRKDDLPIVRWRPAAPATSDKAEG